MTYLSSPLPDALTTIYHLFQDFNTVQGGRQETENRNEKNKYNVISSIFGLIISVIRHDNFEIRENINETHCRFHFTFVFSFNFRFMLQLVYLIILIYIADCYFLRVIF